MLCPDRHTSTVIHIVTTVRRPERRGRVRGSDIGQFNILHSDDIRELTNVYASQACVPPIPLNTGESTSIQNIWSSINGRALFFWIEDHE